MGMMNEVSLSLPVIITKVPHYSRIFIICKEDLGQDKTKSDKWGDVSFGRG